MKLIITATFLVAYATVVHGIDRVVTLRADCGDFLCRIRRGKVDPIEAAKPRADVFCQFKKIQLDKDTVAFQADNGRFLSRIYRGGTHNIEAQNTSIDIYSMFKVNAVGTTNKITLEADNGLFWSRINRGYNYNPIESTKRSADISSQFEVVGVKPSFKKPPFWSGLVLNPVFTFQADNGKYLCRYTHNGVQGIEAVKSVPDRYCEFVAIRIDEKWYAFKGDNGKFISSRNYQNRHTIEAAKSSIDKYSQFKIRLVHSNVITLKADNGLFWSRINRGRSYNPIELVMKSEKEMKKNPDVYSQFTISLVRFV